MKLKNIIHFAVVFFTLTGCSIVDLRRLNITTNPSTTNQILKSDESITVNFGADGIREKTSEQAVTLTAGNGLAGIRLGGGGLSRNGQVGGSVSGSSITGGSLETDFAWEGSVLTVIPVRKLYPGIRYTLTVKGLIELEDGRSYTVDLSIPFYYVSNGERPYLVSFSPVDNGICEVDSSIRLTFSSEIDKKSFEDNLSISPSIKYNLEWDENTVFVTPDEGWENLTRYTWTITEDVTDTEGFPLAEAYSHSIIVQNDTIPPAISSFYAADFTGNTLTPGQSNLNYLAYNDVIYMVFTEAVKASSLSSAFRISPAFDGTIAQYSSNEFLFLPYKGWDFKTEYTLTIGTDLEDSSGNKTREPIKVIFKPDILINPVNVIQIDGNGDNTFSVNTFNSAVPISADADAFGKYSFTVTFDNPYDMENRSSIEDAIQCSAYFPANSEPVRDSAVWNASGTRVTLGYTGFVASVPPHEENIYKLTIHGGTATINSSGGYIPDDVYIYIRAE